MEKSDSEDDLWADSDNEVDTTQVHSNGVEDDVSGPRDSIPDPWWEATDDNELHDMLNEILTLPRTEKPQDGDLAKSEKDKRLQHRRDLYMSMIKQRLSIEASNGGHEPSEKSFIHQVVKSASSTDLRITEFLLTLILEQDPSQFCRSEDNTPLLHRAIAAEGERDQCKGLTSLICKLVQDPSEAIAKTNAKGENCVHLLIRNNIHDAKKIIGFVKADSTPNALEQGRNSEDPDSDGNTPLHDLLHFKNFARRTIPCLEHKGPSPGPTTASPHNKLCLTCHKNKQANEKLPDFSSMAALMVALLKGAPEVLTQHNSTGRSPYSFHWATREEITERRKAEKKASTAENANGRINEKSSPAEEKTTTGYATKSQRSKDSKGRDGQEKGSDAQKERPESTTGSHKDVWDYVCKNSDKAVTYLEDRLYKLTADYPCITRFFFQDIKKAGNRNKRKYKPHHHSISNS